MARLKVNSMRKAVAKEFAELADIKDIKVKLLIGDGRGEKDKPFRFTATKKRAMSIQVAAGYRPYGHNNGWGLEATVSVYDPTTKGYKVIESKTIISHYDSKQILSDIPDKLWPLLQKIKKSKERTIEEFNGRGFTDPEICVGEYDDDDPSDWVNRNGLLTCCRIMSLVGVNSKSGLLTDDIKDPAVDRVWYHVEFTSLRGGRYDNEDLLYDGDKIYFIHGSKLRKRPIYPENITLTPTDKQMLDEAIVVWKKTKDED